MDYEKEYKGLVAKIKNAHLYAQTDSTKNVLENILPELIESKDERIRKELLASFKYQQRESRTDKEWLNGIKFSEVVAWLEKQGEPTEINPSEFDLRLNKLLKQFKTLPKEEFANSLSFYLNVVQNDGTYKPEKQGQNEQILANSAKTCMDAWSEEDDYNVQCCIAKAVADMQTGNVGRNNELIDWLKALKQRLAL